MQRLLCAIFGLALLGSILAEEQATADSKWLPYNFGCTYYTIRPGDTCYALGIQQALNPGVNCMNLQIGQVVCLYYTNFNALPCRANTYLYTIRPGDNCSALAVNATLHPWLNCDNMQAGQTACIPYGPPAAFGKCGPNSYSHVVGAYDTCSNLGINPALNPLLPCNNGLPVGATICIYYDSVFCGYNSYVYAVKPNDTCGTIGLNPVNFPHLNCEGLLVGQHLCVPLQGYYPNTNLPPYYGYPYHPQVYPYAGLCARYYTVVSGDTCWSIGQRNGYYYPFLVGLNPGLNCAHLIPGQVICV